MNDYPYGCENLDYSKWRKKFFDILDGHTKRTNKKNKLNKGKEIQESIRALRQEYYELEQGIKDNLKKMMRIRFKIDEKNYAFLNMVKRSYNKKLNNRV